MTTHPLYDAYARNSDGESSWDAAQSVNLPKIERVRAECLAVAQHQHTDTQQEDES